MTITTTRPTRTSTALITVVRVIFVFLALVSMAGAFVFSFSRGDIAGYAFGAVLIVFGLGFAYTALRLGRPTPALYRLALGLAVLEVVWSFYKVFIYGEPETTLMLVLSAAATAILLIPSVSRRFR